MNAARTTNFLMANLGSELIRFFALRSRGGSENEASDSAKRALVIIGKIMARPDAGGGRDEARILKNVIEDALSNHPQLSVGGEELNAYFAPLAQRLLSRGEPAEPLTK